MSGRRFVLVDVFTDRRYAGNALAVLPDAEGLAPERMQAIAREFNLSETTFVFPPETSGTDVRVRIFTPGRELPFAGHPTLGTAFVLIREGRIPFGPGGARLTLGEGVGPVPVRVFEEGGQPGLVQLSAPLPTFAPELADRAAVATMLSLAAADLRPDAPVQPVSCGVPFLFVPLASLSALGQARLRPEPWEEFRAAPALTPEGVFPFTLETGSAANVRGRMLPDPALGIGEDPATGSAAAPLGAYLVRHGLVARAAAVRLTLEQGIEMGRPSLLHVEVDCAGDEIVGLRVGGRCVAVGRGELEERA